jgi:Fe2+ transport system protein B
LARDLGVPVVPTSARYGEGLEELVTTIHQVATGETRTRPHRIKALSQELEAAVAEIVRDLKSIYPELPNGRWVALRLMDGDERIIAALQNGELEAMAEMQLSEQESARSETLGATA